LAQADISTPGSPYWWLDLLERRQLMRRAGLQTMESYYSGDHPLPFLTDAHRAKMRDEFRRLLEESQSNFMRLVVDAPEERLEVDGWTTGGEDEGDGRPVDREAEAIWVANDMASLSQVAFLEALIKGMSYLTVWEDLNGPTISVEDPLETIVAYVPGSAMQKRAAGAKFWIDDLTGDARANVHLPDRIVRFRGAGSLLAPSTTQTAANALEWEAVNARWEMLDIDAVVPNPLGVVNIVPLRNRPRLLLEGESEIADVWKIQQQINGFLFLLALAGYFGAHKQRWAVGLTLHEDSAGKPVEPFDVAIDRLIYDENPNAKFGEFRETSLEGYIKAIEQKVAHIATTTRTPRHYLNESGQSPSGDAIRSAESGLVKKVLRKQRTFGQGLEEAMHLARIMGGEKNPPRAQVVWASPQTDEESALTDAVLKQFGANLIDQHTALKKLGYSNNEATAIIASTPQNVPAAPPLKQEPTTSGAQDGGEQP
jgi:hypothetical protein